MPSPLITKKVRYEELPDGPAEEDEGGREAVAHQESALLFDGKRREFAVRHGERSRREILGCRAGPGPDHRGTARSGKATSEVAAKSMY